MGSAMTPEIFERKLNEFLIGKKLLEAEQSGGDGMCYLTIFYEDSTTKSSKPSRTTDKNLQQKQ